LLLKQSGSPNRETRKLPYI